VTEFYTCEGKGGEYELLGLAIGAGLTKGEDRQIYRDTTTGQLFLRGADDFKNRMVKLVQQTPPPPPSAGEPTRYEQFHARFKRDPGQFKDELRGDGSYSYIAQAKQLERMSSKMGGDMLVYLFGEQLGNHLAHKFAGQCGRNLLFFLTQLTSEYRMFILYELKTNPHVLYYG
jgi:hypothetical protein